VKKGGPFHGPRPDLAFVHQVTPTTFSGGGGEEGVVEESDNKVANLEGGRSLASSAALAGSKTKISTVRGVNLKS